MVPKKIVLCLFLSLFSGANEAELIEFKQAGIAQVKGFVGIGCGAGVMTGVHLTSDTPRALCAPLTVDPLSIVQIKAQKDSRYVCPLGSAILLVSPDTSIVVCGEPASSRIRPLSVPSQFVDYRSDVPACPSGQVVTAISLTQLQAECTKLIE
ncbi:hypothetical protein MN202_17940 [Rheinheimera muenzenbergensis]|uniref:Uncharacterized protein n=1 Tax=Rheinheimera muenzenbergensis TaxID=1193628 RepID=A0ABU8CB41_9GAMM